MPTGDPGHCTFLHMDGFGLLRHQLPLTLGRAGGIRLSTAAFDVMLCALCTRHCRHAVAPDPVRPPTIERDDGRFALPFERRGQLVAYLALKGGWVPRAELAALLWPDQPSKLAYTNLRKALFRLQSLPGAPAVESSAASVRIDVPTDVDEFERARDEGRATDALALRRGELLAGFDDDGNEAWSAWLRFERDRLRAQWREMALTLLEAATDAAARARHLRQAARPDPLDEAAARAQISWLARSGQVARAHQAYDAFAQKLDEELGLAPGVELERLGESLDAPPSAPPKAQPAAPLQRDDGFVGRSDRAAPHCRAPWQQPMRLLTLVGRAAWARRGLRDAFSTSCDPGMSTVAHSSHSTTSRRPTRSARASPTSSTSA